MSQILIIEDEATLARNAARFLERAGQSVCVCADLAQGRHSFDTQPPDAVVLDQRLPDGSGLALIQQLRAADAQCPILLITGHGSIELAVEAMKAGANDLLTKPLSLADLHERLELLLKRQRERSRLQYFEQRDRGNPLLGDSIAMQSLLQRIDRLAQAARGLESGTLLPPILISGETGVGKGLVARACHDRSLGSTAPFVELNCAAIPDSLLETELFGHERGAFTDAKERKLGLLEAADGGSLFLDEVGEMALPLQAKLLKVIEDGRLRRVGSTQERQVRVRLIAASNQDLAQAVEQGRFRADLYFRLRVLPLQVAPLRERDADALLLATHFLQMFGQRYRRPELNFSDEARRALALHSWPGNVRELRNVVEQAVLLASGPAIERIDLMLPAPKPRVDEGGSTLDKLEREALLRALQDSHDNVSAAARALGISRDTLRYRMDKHGLKAAP